MTTNVITTRSMVEITNLKYSNKRKARDSDFYRRSSIGRTAKNDFTAAATTTRIKARQSPLGVRLRSHNCFKSYNKYRCANIPYMRAYVCVCVLRIWKSRVYTQSEQRAPVFLCQASVIAMMLIKSGMGRRQSRYHMPGGCLCLWWTVSDTRGLSTNGHDDDFFRKKTRKKIYTGDWRHDFGQKKKLKKENSFARGGWSSLITDDKIPVAWTVVSAAAHDHRTSERPRNRHRRRHFFHEINSTPPRQ